jgi:hypothetical protein
VQEGVLQTYLTIPIPRRKHPFTGTLQEEASLIALRGITNLFIEPSAAEGCLAKGIVQILAEDYI